MKNYSKWKSPDRPHTAGVVIYGSVAIALHTKTDPSNPLSATFLYEMAVAVSKVSGVCLGEIRPDVWVVDKGDFVLVKVNSYAVNVPKRKLHGAFLPYIVQRLQRFMLGWRQQHRNHLVLRVSRESSEINRYRWSSEHEYVTMAIGYMIGRGREDALPPPAALVEVNESKLAKSDALIRRLANLPSYVQPLFVMETR